MNSIEAAIAAFESRELGEETSYRKIAAKYGVDRSTLSRRHQQSQRTKHTKDLSQRALNPQQEEELVVYIEGLTRKGLPPTREMIINFASQVAHRQLSEAWVTRFINRHSIDLASHWTTGIDAVRHYADSGYKYKLYFDLLHQKIVEHEVEQENTYNMDKKGFMIGVLGRTKRVFSKQTWIEKGVRAPIQDGNREWITVLASVCADGSALPPTLIYQAKNGAIRDTWVEGITSGEHPVHVVSSPSGWTNNDIGLSWIKQVFDQYTKEKCRRSYRLLILDGHGSHVTMDFIEYCHQNRILLAIFPPHSTHTLQSLDVVMFKPLSSAYTSELAHHQQHSLGYLPIKKGDFFPLFWSAWITPFKKETILKSFEATGIWPMNANVILQRFSSTSAEAIRGQTDASRLSLSDWYHIERLMRSAIQDRASNEAKQLSTSLHHLQVQNDLLRHENKGLKAALSTKKKRKKHGKVLPLGHSGESHGGAVLYSPRTVQRARDRALATQREEEKEHLQKLQRKKQREDNKYLKQLQLKEKREERERLKVVREKERAEKAKRLAHARREKQDQRDAANTAKALQLSQRDNQTTSQRRPAKKRSKRRAVAAAGGDAAAPAPRAPSPPTTSRGRPINLPSKFR
jgi:hypothetical protein